MGVSPLADLIKRQQDAFTARTSTELTYADIARRGGDGLTRGEVSDLANKVPKQMPKLISKIQSLARGLDATEEEVTEAWAETVGFVTMDMARKGKGRPRS